MAEIAKRYGDQLKRIKKNIEKSYIHFKPNYDRFHEFQRIVFKTGLNDDDISTLEALGKPVIEFNILNAYVSRLCGEFSKQEPSIAVRADNGVPVDPQTIEVIEGHLRHIFFEAQKQNTQYNVYRDILSGGFSSFKVWTEYAHEMSMDQVIKIGRVQEPTLCGWDPIAKLPSKSDGNYAFEFVPMAKEDFKRKYPDVDISELSFTRDAAGFDWSYQTAQDDVLIMCHYYEKAKKRIKIVKLANNKVMTMQKYEEFLLKWQESGTMEQPPAIVGNPRWTEITTIDRYKLIGTQILQHKETDFKAFPIPFADGDSVIIKEAAESSYSQFTKPYVYHAKGIQRLKNFSGQCLANFLEDMVMHKFKVAKESLPQEDDYLDAYKNPQKAAVLVYNAFSDMNPDQAIPAPQEIAIIPAPPEVTNTFATADQITQGILGSYDAQLGINDNQLSGVAIVEGATQSNATAMPYIVNYMQALNEVAQIIIDLIPKYYVTPRTIPIIGLDGKRSYQKINQEGGVSFNYDENALQVKVEASVNSTIAKNRALQQIIALMQASPLFAQFMNEEGLEVLLDNVEFRGVDILKQKTEEWMQKMKQMQQQQSQQPSPEQMKAQLAQAQIQQKAQQAQGQLMIDQQKLKVDQMKILADMQQTHQTNQVQALKAQTEHFAKQVDLEIKGKSHNLDVHNMIHTHAMDHRQAKENQNAASERKES